MKNKEEIYTDIHEILDSYDSGTVGEIRDYIVKDRETLLKEVLNLIDEHGKVNTCFNSYALTLKIKNLLFK